MMFDLERLQCLRRNIEMRDASVKRQLELVSHEGPSYVVVLETDKKKLHNLINLRDRRVTQLIAETSAQLARETKRGSSASKALAVVTTIFLPGTFIAVILSTSSCSFTHHFIVFVRHSIF